MTLKYFNISLQDNTTFTLGDVAGNVTANATNFINGVLMNDEALALLYSLYNPLTKTLNWTAMNETYGVFDGNSTEGYLDKINTQRIQDAKA